MWSKLSQALKGPKADNEQSVTPDVMSSVYEQHPNLSVFHKEEQESEVPFPTPSPPGSPSKNGRKKKFRRASKVPKADSDTESFSPSSLRLQISLPKKVKSSLNLNTNVSQSSLSRGSTDTARPSQDSVRKPNNSLENKFGSVRSILRDPKTPGTGQSVRFFSRDAYKVISPDVSAASDSEPPPTPLSFLDRLQKATRPSAATIFADHKDDEPMQTTPPMDSMTLPAPPSDVSNLFDMSLDHELPPISVDYNGPFLDSAIEVPESIIEDATAIGPSTSTPVRPPQMNDTVYLTAEKSQAQHDRSQSFSFGQTVFHSMAKSSTSSSADSSAGSLAPSPVMSKNRHRAMSDTVFRSSISSSGSSAPPEADINDTSGGALVVSTAAASPGEPDPFRADARTYYTPQTLIPPTPPQNQVPQHTRTASKEEDLIWSLRTQLAVQQELCAQFEVDLASRDELVGMLQARLTGAEKDGKDRRNAARALRKKVAELERACRGLEEEVERSREDSLERSVMDEASGEALRELHRRIAGLERERGDWEKRKDDIVEENKRLAEKLKEKEESEQVLREGITSAQEEMEKLGHLSFSAGEGEEELRKIVMERERENEENEEKYRAAELEWEEERAKLVATANNLSIEKEAITAESLKKEEKYNVLQAELEAQWKHTEAATEQIEMLKAEKLALEQERDAFREQADATEERMHEMEVEWTESENKRSELEGEMQEIWTAKEETDKEKEELGEQLRAEREHAEDLTQALQEREDRVTELNEECQFAQDSVARLEKNVQQLKTELSSSSERVVSLQSALESLREEMSSLKREHSRAIAEQTRELQDTAMRESEARSSMEALVREKAEMDVLLATLRERAAEADRLRRVVHELQQESADKEVKIMQLTKGRAQDKEDLNGLNIALDSKQQELELLKRRQGIRGTAGSTPAQPSKITHSRRESSVSTPGFGRPSSALSDVSAKESGRESKLETPSTAKKALGKSIRVNGSAGLKSMRSIEGSMRPPPTTKPRASMGTPTPGPSRLSSLSRSSSASALAGPQRRASSSLLRTRPTIGTSPSLSEVDEKENVSTPVTAKIVRRPSVPTPS